MEMKFTWIILLLSMVGVSGVIPNCPMKCNLVYDPVCASDGQTYINACNMRKIACILSKQLKMAYFGMCIRQDDKTVNKKAKSLSNIISGKIKLDDVLESKQVNLQKKLKYKKNPKHKEYKSWFTHFANSFSFIKDNDYSQDITTSECSTEKETPSTTAECSTESEIPTTTPECSTESKTPSTTLECSTESEIPTTTPECSTESETPSTTPECSTESETPSTTPECSTESETPTTTPECLTESETPSTTPECSTESETPTTTPECSTESETPSTTPECSTESEIPTTTPECSTESETPSTTPECSTESEIPTTTPECSTESESPTTTPECSTESETPTTTPECSTESKTPSTTLECSTESETPSTTPECSTESEIPTTTPECSTESETPTTTPECSTESETPSTTPECSTESETPSTTPECSTESETPTTTPECSTESETPTTTPECSTESETPSTTPECSTESETPSTTPECSTESETPSTTPECSTESETPTTTPECSTESETPSTTPECSTEKETPTTTPECSTESETSSTNETAECPYPEFTSPIVPNCRDAPPPTTLFPTKQSINTSECLQTKPSIPIITPRCIELETQRKEKVSKCTSPSRLPNKKCYPAIPKCLHAKAAIKEVTTFLDSLKENASDVLVKSEDFFNKSSILRTIKSNQIKSKNQRFSVQNIAKKLHFSRIQHSGRQHLPRTKSLMSTNKLRKSDLNCNLNCTNVIRPVCGCDGIIYKNLCCFKKEKCLGKKHIWLVQSDKCKNFNSYKLRLKQNQQKFHVNQQTPKKNINQRKKTRSRFRSQKSKLESKSYMKTQHKINHEFHAFDKHQIQQNMKAKIFKSMGIKKSNLGIFCEP